jgi:hypothetical protein
MSMQQSTAVQWGKITHVAEIVNGCVGNTSGLKIDQKYQSWKQMVIIVLVYSFAHRQIIMLRQDAYQVLRNKLVIFCRSLFWLNQIQR